MSETFEERVASMPDPSEHVWGATPMSEPEREVAVQAIWGLEPEEPVLVEGLGWVPWGELKSELLRRNAADAAGEDWRPIRVGFVYLVATVEGLSRFKIGYAGNPEQRFSAIQAMSPVKLKLLAYSRGTVESERTIHKALDGHRLHGEWFDGAGMAEARRLIGDGA